MINSKETNLMIRMNSLKQNKQLVDEEEMASIQLTSADGNEVCHKFVYNNN